MRFREKQKEIDVYQVAAPLRTENGNVVAETGYWIAVVDPSADRLYRRTVRTVI